MIITQTQPVFKITPVNKQEEIIKEIGEINIAIRSEKDKARQESDLKLENIKPPLDPDEKKGKIIDVTG